MSAPFHQVARRVAPAGTWSSQPLDSVTLDYDERFRRRVVLTCDGGSRVLLDLVQARVLNDGDALVTDEGALIAVRAASESLLEIRCRDRQGLLRIVWHLGNRHLPTEIAGDRLRIRADHVIAAMLRQLGAELVPLSAPFNPEGGAYEHGSGHRHERPSP